MRSGSAVTYSGQAKGISRGVHRPECSSVTDKLSALCKCDAREIPRSPGENGEPRDDADAKRNAYKRQHATAQAFLRLHREEPAAVACAVHGGYRELASTRV